MEISTSVIKNTRNKHRLSASKLINRESTLNFNARNKNCHKFSAFKQSSKQKARRRKHFPYKFSVLSSRLQQKLIYGFMAVSNNKIIIILLLPDLVFGASFSSLFVCPSFLPHFETRDESWRESLLRKNRLLRLQEDDS